MYRASNLLVNAWLLLMDKISILSHANRASDSNVHMDLFETARYIESGSVIAIRFNYATSGEYDGGCVFPVGLWDVIFP